MKIRDKVGGFWLLMIAVLLSHSLLAIIPPLFSDEAMFWEWSRHPAFGYYAHPPMTAWLIMVMTGLFGTFQYSVRLTSILLHLGTIALLYRMALEITRSRPLALAAIVLYAVLPISLILGTAITTDSPLIFFFTATVYFFRRAVVEDRKLHWYFAAIAGGGMMLSKFMAVLFFPGALLFILSLKRHRRCLATREPYLAMLLALLIFSPFLIWNMNNRWLTFQFNLFVRQQAQGLDPLNPLKYMAGQMMAASPLVFVVIVIVLCRLLPLLIRRLRTVTEVDRATESILLLWFIVAFPLIFFLPIGVFSEIGAHFAAVIYPAACLLLVIWVASDKNRVRFESIRRRRTYGVCLSTAAMMTTAIFIVIAFPRLVPDRLIYTRSVYEEAPIVSHYFGWRAVGKRIAAIRQEWAERPEGLFLTAKDYGLASMLGFYTPGRPQFYLMNLGRDVIHGKSYLIWEKGRKTLGANTLYVSDTPFSYRSRLKGFFRDIAHLPPYVIRDHEGRILRVFYFTLGIHYLGGEPDNLSLW
jgi:4-amino-4-deoxy-L-arabinose transferase-like glycosyltransferase